VEQDMKKTGRAENFGRKAPEKILQLPSHYSSSPTYWGHIPFLHPPLRP